MVLRHMLVASRLWRRNETFNDRRLTAYVLGRLNFFLTSRKIAERASTANINLNDNIDGSIDSHARLRLF